MSLRHLALGIALVSAVASGNAAYGRQGDLVLSVPLGDPEMRAASHRARAELESFYERLANPAPDEGEFMIAYDIIPGEDEELVWVDQLQRSPLSVTGTLRSQPQRARASAGDRVTVGEAAIVDWTYRKGGVMQGGYTNRVLISRMPPDESAMLREYLGW